jgi:hypothetical protein
MAQEAAGSSCLIEVQLMVFSKSSCIGARLGCAFRAAVTEIALLVVD